MNTADPQNPW